MGSTFLWKEARRLMVIFVKLVRNMKIYIFMLEPNGNQCLDNNHGLKCIGFMLNRLRARFLLLVRVYLWEMGVPWMDPYPANTTFAERLEKNETSVQSGYFFKQFNVDQVLEKSTQLSFYSSVQFYVLFCSVVFYASRLWHIIRTAHRILQ